MILGIIALGASLLAGAVGAREQRKAAKAQKKQNNIDLAVSQLQNRRLRLQGIEARNAALAEQEQAAVATGGAGSSALAVAQGSVISDVATQLGSSLSQDSANAMATQRANRAINSANTQAYLNLGAQMLNTGAAFDQQRKQNKRDEAQLAALTPPVKSS